MLNEDKDEIIPKYDLPLRKTKAKNLINNYLTSKEKNEIILDKALSLDDTLPDIYFQKLKLKQNDHKLIQKSYDLLDKAHLEELKIEKKMNYKDIYFYIINYLENIKLNEPKKAYLGFEDEEFDSSENGINDDDSNNSIKSKNEENKIISRKIEVSKAEINDENLSDSENKTIVNDKIKLDITSLLIIKESIKINEIKKKFSHIYESLFSFLNYRNNYPDFESEFFYYNSIRYMLETFKRLIYKKFIQKIITTKAIKLFTGKIKNGRINDKLIKYFYYYIMNSQYSLNTNIINSLIEYDENDINLINNNKEFTIKNNILYDRNNNILIENVDYYSIKNLLSKGILTQNDILDLDFINQYYYSIKGLLCLNTTFNKEEGDKTWEEFLSSTVLDDLVKELYEIKKNRFKEKEVINLFKESSYYFPNFNDDFLALSHKELISK